MRLLFVPQYPSKLRYQQWYYSEFPKQLGKYFDEVKIIGGFSNDPISANPEDFSPVEQSIHWETQQINEYMNLELKGDDVMLINDLSFPGLFPNILYHKRPNKVFMLCHGTSKNHLDYYMFVRKAKWPIEKAHASMCEKVFLATEYHKEKLGFDNAVVTGLPYPPMIGYHHLKKERDVISVARPTKQKVDMKIEAYLENATGVRVERPNKPFNEWDEYFKFIGESKIMLITANEETFGYQVVDAIINNCIPIAPHKCSYPELLPREYLYKDKLELWTLVEDILYRFHKGEKVPAPELKCDEMMKNFYRRIADEMRA